MHALHGNSVTPWQTQRRRPGEARDLQELQSVARLRSLGWTIPAEIHGDYQLRVYDTRVEPSWLAALTNEVTGGRPLATVRVGGDFLSGPDREDAKALHPTEVTRPAQEGPCHIVELPRPHHASWGQRCLTQMRMEDHDSELVWYLVVPRDRCGGGTSLEDLERMLPQASPLFRAEDMVVDVMLVGEWAPLVKVPAAVDEKVLPPRKWIRALLPVDRVLVALVVRRALGPRRMPSLGPVRGALPEPKPDGMELLRLEYVLPPATRQSGG